MKRNGIWSSAKINYNASVYTFDIGTKVSFISIVCPRVVGSVTFWWSLTKKNHICQLSTIVIDRMENTLYFFMYTSTDLHKETHRKENKFLTEIYYIFFSILKYFGHLKQFLMSSPFHVVCNTKFPKIFDFQPCLENLKWKKGVLKQKIWPFFRFAE